MLITGLAAGGIGIALAFGVGKMIRDMKTARQDRPLAPWEREEPPRY